MTFCVSCQKPLEYSKTTRLCTHKCSPLHEKGRMAAHRAAYATTPRVREKTFDQRLTDGFRMAAGKGVDLTDYGSIDR